MLFTQKQADYFIKAPIARILTNCSYLITRIKTNYTNFWARIGKRIRGRARIE